MIIKVLHDDMIAFGNILEKEEVSFLLVGRSFFFSRMI